MKAEEGFWAYNLRKLGCFVLAVAGPLWVPPVLGWRLPVLLGVALLQLVLFNVLLAKTDPDQVSGPGT